MLQMWGKDINTDKMYMGVVTTNGIRNAPNYDRAISYSCMWYALP